MVSWFSTFKYNSLSNHVWIFMDSSEKGSGKLSLMAFQWRNTFTFFEPSSLCLFYFFLVLFTSENYLSIIFIFPYDYFLWTQRRMDLHTNVSGYHYQAIWNSIRDAVKKMFAETLQLREISHVLTQFLWHLRTTTRFTFQSKFLSAFIMGSGPMQNACKREKKTCSSIFTSLLKDPSLQWNSWTSLKLLQSCEEKEPRSLSFISLISFHLKLA